MLKRARMTTTTKLQIGVIEYAVKSTFNDKISTSFSLSLSLSLSLFVLFLLICCEAFRRKLLLST